MIWGTLKLACADWPYIWRADPKLRGCSSDSLAAKTGLNNPNEFFLGRFRRCRIKSNLAGVQEVNAIAYLKDLIVIVYNENNRNLALTP